MLLFQKVEWEYECINIFVSASTFIKKCERTHFKNNWAKEEV
jgi:hypothetical protein